MSRKQWTVKERAAFLADWPYLPMRELVKKYDRPPSTLKAYADLYKVKKHPDFKDVDYFIPGHVPWNKGKKLERQHFHFKPGHTPKNSRPIGSERMVEGVLQRKTGKGYRGWQPVKVVVWEAHNGPVPAHHVICILNGDPMDCRIENLACVSRKDMLNKCRPKDQRKAAKKAWETRRAREEARA